MTHVQVENVFWGPAWANPGQLAPNAAYLNRFTNDIVGSRFMNALAQYGVGHGQYQGATTLTQVPVHGYLKVGQIQATLAAQVKIHRLPPPGPNELYMVYLPPGISIGNAAGYHDDFPKGSYNPVTGHADVHDFIFAAVTYGSPQYQTIVASHELAEAVTDPRPLTGWFNTALMQKTYQGEIADLAGGNVGTLDGYMVTQLYSNAAGRVVNPGM
jgi:hypothetical protein